tara:strand:- start:3185 stop:3772 length:588 start_codon:yes stop_codon:yes gene_type:complete
MFPLARLKRRSDAALVLLLVLATQQLGGAALIQAKAWLAPVLMAQAWSQSTPATPVVKPWPWADTWPVAKLSARRLGVNRIVLAGDSGHALAFGPGHSAASAAPGGEGVSVVSGHRDTHFAFLAELRTGDELTLELPGDVVKTYRVKTITVVDSRLESLARDTSRTGLLLVTCYPFDAILAGGPLRYTVYAEAAS